MATLDEYRAMIQAYTKAHPYLGDVSRYYTANDLVSGGTSEAEMAATNLPQDQWQEKTWQGWRGSMPANELAEYDRLAHEKFLSDRNKKRLAAAASFAAIGGLGALGAGGLGSGTAAGGGGVGALGGLEAMPAGLGTVAEGGFAAIPEIGIGTLGGLEALPAGFGPVSTAGFSAVPVAAGGSSLLDQIGAALGLGGAAGGKGGGLGSILGNGTNWLNLLGNLGGGYLQSQAAGNATDAQLQAARESNALLEKMWQQGRTDQAPYREAGTSALAGIQALLKDPSSITSMPDYQFGLDQGSKALQNSATARGMTYSGQQAKALERYGNDYAGTKLGESFNRLASIAGIGQTATNQTGALGSNYANQAAGNITGMGNSSASGYIGQGNAWNNAFGGALNGISEQALIDAWLKSKNGG